MSEAQILDISSREKKYARESFFEAGVDNLTTAPSQDDDLFEILENIQPVDRGGLRRRWGYVLFSNPSLVARRMYSYQKDTEATGRIILTSTAGIKALNEDGSVWNSSIFTPAGTSHPRSVVSRDYAFFLTGNTADLKKWNGANSGGVTGWGIPTTFNSGGSAGPNNPATAADAGGGVSSWTNPTNVFSSNNANATTTIAGGGAPTSSGPRNPTASQNIAGATPNWSTGSVVFASDDSRATATFSDVDTGPGATLEATGFGFAIPTNASIQGIVVEVERSVAAGSGNIRDFSVLIVKNGSATGTNKADTGTNWPSVDAYKTYGGSADLWGTTWLPADINASNFGIQLRATSTGIPVDNFKTARIDHIRITVHYTENATVAASNKLDVTNFGFAIPGSEVQGIKVEVEGSATTGANTKCKCTLIKTGVPVGDLKSADFSASETTLSFGGSTDLWGATWLSGDINATNFGVRIYAEIQNGVSSDVAIDHVKITVWHAGGASISTAGAGNITLSVGRKYTFVFQNSATSHNSDLLPFTASTGAITSKTAALTSIPVPSDTQADRKLILATADGGDETKLYLIADIAAATTSYTDDTTETTLLTRPIYLETNDFGAEVGVADNTPPPNFTLVTKHRGRLYGVVGQNLYFSKNLDELVTSTGTVTGRWEESWPADNYIDISEGVESPTALLSDGEALYIGTERHIRRLYGDGPENFQAPQVVFNNVGVLNHEVFRTAFLEGAPIGAVWLTPDFRVIISDFNSYRDIGEPIQGTLDSVNPAGISNIHATFVSNEGFDLYVLAIPTGANTECDTLCIYNLESKRWFIWKPTDLITGLLYNVDSMGESQFLFTASTGKIYRFRGIDTQDRVGDTPVSFTATAQTSWLSFGSYTARKLLNELDLLTGDSSLTVTVYGASTIAEFASPTTVKSGTVMQSPLGDWKFYLAGSTTNDRLYRLKFASTGTVADILSAYALTFVPVHFS